MPSNGSSPTSPRSMQRLPNRLSDTAACSVMCLPKDRFEAIRDAVRRGLPRLLSLHDRDGYWPHLAMACATGNVPIDSVHRSGFCSVTGLSWRVQTVAFVEWPRSPWSYSWDVLAKVPIGRLGR
jgi:hypothetical protein